MAPEPSANIHSITFFDFEHKVPDCVQGFECVDKDTMVKLWPEGTSAAMELLDRFFSTKARPSQVGDSSPLQSGAEQSTKQSRISRYVSDRDRADKDTSSRLSPYLASGIISARECIRRAKQLRGTKKVEATRNEGIGMWIQEVGELLGYVFS
jgi:deoxyribodipyrimidine photo-lyase